MNSHLFLYSANMAAMGSSYMAQTVAGKSVPLPTFDLNSVCGDYVVAQDSKKPNLVVQDSNQHVQRIVKEEDEYRVLFSALFAGQQSYYVRQLPDGRVQLHSPTDSSYSFYLLQSIVPGTLQWQNEFDIMEIVLWKKIPATLERSAFFQTNDRSLLPSLSLEQVSDATYSGSSFADGPPALTISTVEHITTPCGIQYAVDAPLPIVFTPSPSPNAEFFAFTAPPGLQLLSISRSLSCVSEQSDRSRQPSPSPNVLHLGDCSSFSSCTSRSNSSEPQTPARDSKQALVTKVEPQVDSLISHLYAKKCDYRKNKNGRWGPPVLRGEDVLFIPAKKQGALENVVEILELIKKHFTIVAASKVSQKKKKRQKKGFLVYLQLASGAEVQSFLDDHYPRFKDLGLKKALF